MKKRMFSLKRQILTISLAFSVIVVLLLVTLLINMVISWQEKTRKNRTDGLLSYEETLETSYSQLNQIVKEIYSENSDFSGLGHFPSAGKRWTNLYNLMNLMKIQTKVYQGIEGLFVFYDGYEHMQYAVNQTLSFSETEQLKKDGQQTLRTSGQVSVDYVSSSEEVKWYNLFLKKNNAAIGGCISLTEGLLEEKEAGAIYGVVFEGTFYQIWPKEDPIEKSSPGAGAFSEKTAGIDYNSLETGENRENDRMIWLQKAGNANLAVVEILPVSLWLYVNKLHLFFLMLILLFIICLIRIEKAVYYELFRPLENMTDTLRNIQAGQWEIDFSVPNRVMEIEDVRESIKLLLAEVEHYKIRFYEEELEKARIQRQYLQIQLAPHFYTNCLKNAYYMLALKEYDQAEVFLQRLSMHLRYLLQQNRSFVKLEEELDFVRNYVDLQKLMTSKPLSCEISADERLSHKMIPIIAIQTFVENSVKYARRNDGSVLQIFISVRYRETEEGNYLDLTIRDNGPGYSEELIAHLNGGKPVEDEKLGIGVRNLLERLKVVYEGDEKPAWYFENKNGAVSELILPEIMTEDIKK